MSLRPRFYIALASAFIAIGAHVIADRFFLYWTVPQIDIPIHMLGGIMAGLFSGVALMAAGKSQTWRAIVLGSLIVGIGWELLEVVMHSVDTMRWWYPYDTVKDLIDDMIGGTIAYLIWKKL